MSAIISLLVIIAVSLLIVRVGTTALVMTGLSWQVASFQAYSAFFGVGFTTAEAELVVNHPVRRRIIKHLILAGNVGFTAGLGSVIVAFVRAENVKAEFIVIAWIGVGLMTLWLLAVTPFIRSVLDWGIKTTLREAGIAHPADFGLLLRVHAGYVISEVQIPAGSLLVGHSLIESRLGSRGVVVLGITREEDDHSDYIGAPSGPTVLRAGDKLTVYASEDAIRDVLRPYLAPDNTPVDKPAQA